MRDFSAWGQDVFTNLLVIPEPRPDTHEYYDDWVDPFSSGCYELTDGPLIYNQEQPEKLNHVAGMCGFEITFTNNHEFEALMVQVKRDGASALVGSAMVLAATAATLF